jgi:hypothetical protein
MVNGFSGWFPPVYTELRRRWTYLRAEQTVSDAAELGVRYIVLHTKEIKKPRLAEVQAALSTLGSRLVASPEGSQIWDLHAVETVLPRSPRHSMEHPFLDRSSWRVAARPNDRKAGLAIDDDITTRWSTGRQRPGNWFEVDFGEITVVHGIDIALGTSVHDHPQGYVLEASRDGESWSTVSAADPFTQSITSYLRPKERHLQMAFPPTEARFLRMSTTRGHPRFHWSIHELRAW